MPGALCRVGSMVKNAISTELSHKFCKATQERVMQHRKHPFIELKQRLLYKICVVCKFALPRGFKPSEMCTEKSYKGICTSCSCLRSKHQTQIKHSLKRISRKFKYFYSV